jgi:hypothetical protein
MMIVLGLIGLFLIVFAGVLLFRSANEHSDGRIYPTKIRLAIFDNVAI